MASHSSDRKDEILGLMMMALGLLVLLSLLPQKLAGHLAPATEADYRNIVGIAGKFINESLKVLLGVFSYTIPFYLLFWGWRLFRGKGGGFYLRATIVLTVLGLGLTVITSLVQQSIAEPPLDWSGGMAGKALADLLVVGLGKVGAYLVVSLIMLIVLVVFTGISLRAVANQVGEILVGGLHLLGRLLPKREKTAKPHPGKPARRKETGESLPAEAAGDLKTPRPPEHAEAEKQAFAEQESDNEEFTFQINPPVEQVQEPGDRGALDLQAEAEDKPKEETERPAPEERPLVRGGTGTYELPRLDLLDPVKTQRLVSQEDLERMGQVLMAKLADFNIQGELLNIVRGPQVSTFEVSPAPGIKVGRISALADDLAMAMHAKRIRIVAPIPGKGAVGVEIPNPTPELVQAREIMESEVFRNEGLEIPLGLGKDLSGKIRVADLTKMPHLLIAGTTGSGKSVCMNVLISSLLFTFTPDQVGLLMIDPKMIELTVYNNIPHLLHPVVTDAKTAARILKWAVMEMEERYKLFSCNAVRNIQDYNYKVASGRPVHLRSDDPETKPEKLPYIVLLVDELSDLMCSDYRNDIEASLVRLAQMARAVGIHLIVATQRPSVDVITGLIKANFPSRLSFQVYSKIDSRTILDVSGAEQLLRNGDMLFMPAGQADPVRIQGSFISSEETERLVAHWREQVERVKGGAPEESGGIGESMTVVGLNDRSSPLDGGEDELDELFGEAAKLVVLHEQGSTSLIQRRLKVGYARAGRIVDQLERAGILGPPDGSKAREVLITPDQLEDYGVF